MNENGNIDKQEIERKKLFDDAMVKMMAINEGVTKRAEAKAEEEIQKASIQVENKEIKGFLLVCSVVFIIGVIIAAIFYIQYSIDTYGYIETFIVVIVGVIGLILIGLVFVAIFFRDPNAAIQPQNPHMKCPHCQTVGLIATKKVDLKKGVSGGKAVAGILTGGLSLLAVGLSREETQTEARCGKCRNVWHF